MLGQFYYGVCYYPEAWDARRHASDIRRIADAGFNYVRMGEGAWSYWEPEEGRYQFDLFDRAIELCHKYKIKVILGTPTYAGPAWIAHKYPEVLRWNFNRVPMKHGGRRFYNYTSPKYLELSDRIVTALAEHYRGCEDVFAWQLDNEFNCHMDASYAPSDTLAFRVWLRKKYRTLDRLNDAWGTRFWSQTYSDWNQIDLPHPTVAYNNPTMLLDESRFISDTVIAFARRQADILRRVNRRWLITHNALFANIDPPKLAQQLDFFSHDHYPLFNAEGDWPGFAWQLAQARSLSFPFGILEQQSGPGGQMEYLLRTPRPGQMRLWAWQSVGHGAKLFGYFRWRTCPYGQEQHWHGILDPDDRDNRRLKEARLTGREFASLPKAFFDAAAVRQVGIFRDFDNEINEARINTYTRHGRGEANRWYNSLSRRHVPVDLLWSDSELTGYRVIVAPHLKITDPRLVKKLAQFVRGGGTLILGAQSGLKDRNCHLVEQTPPGPLRELAGVEVEDWTTLPENESRRARFAGAWPIDMISFVERLRPRKAQPLARWDTGDDLLPAGSAAITLNRVGRGKVIYFGGYLTVEGIDALLNATSAELHLAPLVVAAPEVEVIARQSGRREFVILLNHSRQPQRITGLGRAKRIVGEDEPADGELTLGPLGVAALARTGQ